MLPSSSVVTNAQATSSRALGSDLHHPADAFHRLLAMIQATAQALLASARQQKDPIADAESALSLHGRWSEIYQKYPLNDRLG
jgi:hypothetical protein